MDPPNDDPGSLAGYVLVELEAYGLGIGLKAAIPLVPIICSRKGLEAPMSNLFRSNGVAVGFVKVELDPSEVGGRPRLDVAAPRGWPSCVPAGAATMAPVTGSMVN